VLKDCLRIGGGAGMAPFVLKMVSEESFDQGKMAIRAYTALDF